LLADSGLSFEKVIDMCGRGNGRQLDLSGNSFCKLGILLVLMKKNLVIISEVDFFSGVEGGAAAATAVGVVSHEY